MAVDIESDGVHPGRKAWEIAMIRRDDVDGEREMSMFVDIDLSTADPFGLKIGGFYDRHPYGRYLSGERFDHPSDGRTGVQETVTEHQAAETVARWTHGAHLIGAVPSFDAETLAKLLRDHGLTPAWHYHLLDVEPLALGYLAGKAAEWDPPPGLPGLPWKSVELTEAIGVRVSTDEEMHTAMGDARWAMRIWDKVMGTGIEEVQR